MDGRAGREPGQSSSPACRARDRPNGKAGHCSYECEALLNPVGEGEAVAGVPSEYFEDVRAFVRDRGLQ